MKNTLEAQLSPPISILKFGGTSVGNGERIRRVAQIIAHTVNDPKSPFPIVVVSAMSGVTDALLRLARHASNAEHEECQQELRALKQKHLDAAEKAVHNPEARYALIQDLETAFKALEQDIADVETSAREQGKPRPYHTRGKNSNRNMVGAGLAPALGSGGRPAALGSPCLPIAAWGERLSVLLVAAAANDIGLQVAPVREEVIITSDLQHEGQAAIGGVVGAEPLAEETRVNAQVLICPLIERGIVPVVAGFIGRTATGTVTTLGRNGSDYSATIIGAALDCVEVSIYTDVDGILSADPHIVMNTRLLPRLSYAEAARLSWFGAKVLHPRTLIPIAHRGIPVRVRNTFRPHLHGTEVGPERTQSTAAAAITVRHHLALITMESTDLFGASENAGQVFALAARAGAAPIAICSSSGQHLSFMVEEQAADSVVALLQHDMGNWQVLCRYGLAACACIGSGFTADPRSPARAITALARERIPILTQGASDSGIILIVEDQDSERALRSLHRDLIAPVIPLLRHESKEKIRSSM